MILTKLITAYLITRGVLIVLHKYNVFGLFGDYVMKGTSKFLFRLSKCDFCMEHHVAIIPVIGISLYYGCEWIDVFLPLMVSSLNNIMKK